jgi:hypothetical protein
MFAPKSNALKITPQGQTVGISWFLFVGLRRAEGAHSLEPLFLRINIMDKT